VTQPTWTEKVEAPASEARSLIRFFLKKQLFSEDSPWTLESAGVYSAPFDYGYVSMLVCSGWQGSPADPMAIFIDFQSDATELNNVDTTDDIVSAGDWSYDHTTKRVWVKPYITALGTDPNDADFTFEFLLFASTHGGYYPVTPSTTQEDVEWPAVIAKCPVFKQSFSDQLFGFFPVETSSIELLNQDDSFNPYLYDAVWKNARFEVFNDFVFKPGQLESFRKTIVGLCQTVSQDQSDLSISVRSFIDILNRDYDLKRASEYSFGAISVADQKKYVRKIFGRVAGFVPIGVAFDITIAANTNRDFVFCKDPIANLPNITLTVDDAYANTDTTTKVTATPTGININDRIKLICAGVAKYVDVTAVDYVTKIITHTAVTGRSDAPGDTLYRPFVGRLDLFDGTIGFYQLYPGRDFDVMDFAGCAGIRLVNNFEATVSMVDNGNGAIFDPTKMDLMPYVYGDATLARLPDASNLGAVSKRGGAYSNPIGVLLSIINSAGRFDGAQFHVDQASFASEFAAADDYVGFAVPQLSGGTLPKYRDVVVTLLNSFLGRLYLKDSSAGPALAVQRIGPTKVTPDFVVDSAVEVTSYSQDISYEDAPHRINLNYSFQELPMNNPGTVIAFPPNSSFPAQGSEGSVFIFKNCKQARWAYFTKYEFAFDSYLDNDFTQDGSDQIELMGNRVLWLMSERRNRITLVVKNRFFEANIGDTIELSRDSVPGFAFLFGTLQSRKFILIEKQQSVYGVTLVLDDQKGVEDHSGDWL
jgi:hypothetical protein